MLKRIDESQFLIKSIERLSSLLARQRGLPVMIGLGLFIIGGILQFLNLAFDSRIIEVFQILFHNLGVIIALVGLLLAEPLGQ